MSHLSVEELGSSAPGWSLSVFDQVANRVLWPVLHGMETRASLTGLDFAGWARATHVAARAVVGAWRGGQPVWIHDYQLALLPHAVRALAPHARIGWFCHVPWPGCDTLAVLPHCAEVLAGVLGASYVGFHTRRFRDNFLACVRELTRYPVDVAEATIDVGGRLVRAGVHPVGVPFDAFDAAGADPATQAEAERLRFELGTPQVVLAVDRLDYTKGILERLQAFELLLATRPDLARSVSLVQVGVPTREGIPGYAEVRCEVERAVGAINGRFARDGWVPVRYWARSLAGSELGALYLAADVMAVTPLRDGMNLVAQEFVATRHDGRGVLVLSEFAGAAEYLRAAVLANPWWIERMADALGWALGMDPVEERARMQELRAQARAIDLAGWAPGFLRELGA